MRVRVITPPAPVVTLGEAKRHLRVGRIDAPDEPHPDDPLIEGFIAAATQHIDGPDGWLGRAIGPQLLEATGELGCHIWRLPYAPIIEVESLSVIDTGSTVTVVDPSAYKLDGDDLQIISPATRSAASRHRLRYWAGYGSRNSGEPEKWDVSAPMPIKVAIMLYVGTWYENREDAVVSKMISSLPQNARAETLLSNYRVF